MIRRTLHILTIALVGLSAACAATMPCGTDNDDVHDQYGMHMDMDIPVEEQNRGYDQGIMTGEVACQTDSDCTGNEKCQQRIIPSCELCPGGISVKMCVPR